MTPAELRARREALGLSQKRLAEHLDLPANTLARWERDEMPIRHPEILRLALDRLADELARA